MKYSKKKLTEILDAHYSFEDCDAGCLRDYFFRLLERLWVEQEGFSGKRPFGNSGWDYDIYKCLVDKGYVLGIINEHGELDNFDMSQANQLIEQLLLHVMNVTNYKYKY